MRQSYERHGIGTGSRGERKRPPPLKPEELLSSTELVSSFCPHRAQARIVSIATGSTKTRCGTNYRVVLVMKISYEITVFRDLVSKAVEGRGEGQEGKAEQKQTDRCGNGGVTPPAPLAHIETCSMLDKDPSTTQPPTQDNNVGRKVTFSGAARQGAITVLKIFYCNW